MPDVTMPNGDIVSFPDDMPKEQIKGLIASKFPELTQDQSPQPAQKGFVENSIENLGAFQSGVADMASFGFGDEMKAGFQAAIRSGLDPDVAFNQAYDTFLNKARDTQGQLKKDNPYAYGTGQVAGAIGGSALGGGLVPQAGRALSGAKALPKFVAATGIGGASGGLYGAGTGETPEERQAMAILYGAGGGLAGSAGSLVGKYGGDVAQAVNKTAIRPLTSRVKTLLSKKTALPAMDKAAAQDVLRSTALKQDEITPAGGAIGAVDKVGTQLRKDFGDDFDKVMEAYKVGDASLAELYGSRTRTLAQGAAQYSGGKARAQKFFDEKIGDSYTRIIDSIGKNVTDIDNYYATADDVLAKGRAKAAPLYDKAYSSSIDIDEEGMKLLTSPEIQGAIKKARSTFTSELEGVQEDSVKLLDYAKKVLDDEIGVAKRAGENNVVGYKTGIKNRLIDTIDKQVPDYKKARAVSGDYLSATEAMDNGRKALNVDSELLKKQISQMGDADKEAFRIGLGKSIRDKVSNANEGTNPFNRVLGSPEKKKRIEAVLTPSQYKNLQSDLKAEDLIYKMRNEVLGGSPTAGKQEAKKLVEGAADAASVVDITNVPRRAMVDGLKKLVDGMNDKSASKISEILYEADPKKKLEILNGLKAAKNFTPQEKALVKKVYFENADKFDILRTTGASTAGRSTSIGSNNNE